ncbi:MAG: urea transporter [Aromatoleum sp.]|jgi:urea transporter|uniref:urea transporter n=1 Tax=Aromatoleum sp. TaxID=2307007 RepID=UPI0028960EE8|nr:urea transporter [Aromatoleum sp.]MDT3669439.1 urea transporter [Aromatoleum sp.]
MSFVDVCLRGCAQVMFQNNPLCGAFFLLAIIWGAWAEGRPEVAVGAVLATVIATATGYVLHLDRTALRSGLCGYNGTLLGVALPTFLLSNAAMWVCLVLGAIVSTISMLTISRMLKTWKVAALTAPFVFTTWFFLLATYSFSRIHSAGLPEPAIPHQFSMTVTGELTLTGFGASTLNGIAQVFLLPSAISGVLILIGLFLSSRGAGAFALVGSLLSVAAADLLGAPDVEVHNGLFAFSGVLTAVALGDAFNRPSWRVLAYAVIGVLFTVVTQGALNTLLEPVGIPTLTMPFVLASWLFLVPNQELMPDYRR